jgi:hypothetical protein
MKLIKNEYVPTPHKGLASTWPDGIYIQEDTPVIITVRKGISLWWADPYFVPVPLEDEVYGAWQRQQDNYEFTAKISFANKETD